jgi:hypothetical protein
LDLELDELEDESEYSWHRGKNTEQMYGLNSARHDGEKTCSASDDAATTYSYIHTIEDEDGNENENENELETQMKKRALVRT